MTNGIRLFVFLGALSALFLYGPCAQAQAMRTWVSGVGDDANPCSRTAPCKTFAGAISKTGIGGEIDALDPGGFGTVGITKAITLDGGGGQIASTSASSTDGIVVQPSSGTVILRNLSVIGNGTGLSGIVFNSGTTLIVENCKISGFVSYGIALSPTSGTSRIAIADTSVTNNSQGGVQVKSSGGTTTISMTGVTADSNGFGIGVDTTGGGSVSLIIDHATINENTGNGLQALGTGSTVEFSASMLVHNSNGVNVTAPANVFSFVNNLIAQNSSNNVVGTLGTKSLQ